jgi:hypothetical protein
MVKTNQHLHTVLVDGQELIIPDEAGWTQLRHKPDVSGIKLGVQEMLWRLREFVQQYPEFTLALYDPGVKNRKSFLPIVLLRMKEDKWQRVQIERLTCPVCRWKGETANPTIIDLYFGAQNEDLILKKSFSLPRVSCPRCGSRLPNHPIWTEPLQPQP